MEGFLEKGLYETNAREHKAWEGEAFMRVRNRDTYKIIFCLI